MRRGLLRSLVWVAGSVAAACLTVAVPAADVIPLGLQGARLSRLSAAPNGQVVYAVDESRRAVVAIDPFAAGTSRDVVAPAAAGGVEPVSVVALPGDTLVVVCRADEEWWLRSYRLLTTEPAPAERPVRELRLGSAPGSQVPSTAVSRSRDWFAVAGLPPPLPAVVRAAFAGPGVRLRPNGPVAKEPPGRPVAVAVGPDDDLMVFEAADPRGAACLVCIGPAGRELLRLDAGLIDVRGAAFARDGSALWVIAGAAGGDVDQPAGVWRLDASIRDGIQEVRPTCVVRLDEPHDVAAVSDQSLVVVHGVSPRAVSRIDLVATGANDPKQASGEETR